MSRRGEVQTIGIKSTTGKQAFLQELNVTPVTVFLTPKHADPPANPAIDKLRSPVARALSDESRRSSFSGNPFRPRQPSQTALGADADHLVELRRKLKRLDDARTASKDLLQMTPAPSANHEPASIASASDPPLQRALSNASMPSTLQERSNGLLSTRSRLSFGREPVKAAPAVSASNEIALGQLEAVAGLGIQDKVATNSGLTTPRQATREPHPPPADLFRPFTSTYEGHDPNVMALLERTYAENTSVSLSHLGPVVERSHAQRRGPPSRTKQPSRASDQPTSLVAHLSVHESPILGLFSPPDQAYLLSADSDGVICVWDVARFERSVSNKPRLTHRLEGGHLTAACPLVNRSAFAFAVSHGTIQLLRITNSSNGSLKQARLVHAQSLTYARDQGEIVFLQNVYQGK